MVPSSWLGHRVNGHYTRAFPGTAVSRWTSRATQGGNHGTTPALTFTNQELRCGLLYVAPPRLNRLFDDVLRGGTGQTSFGQAQSGEGGMMMPHMDVKPAI